MTKRSLVPEEVLPLKKPAPLRRGVRLWEINTSLHCSIIGTCLSTTELRKILMRMNVTGAQTADEHELHVLGVIAAGRWDDSMFLQKALISDIVER